MHSSKRGMSSGKPASKYADKRKQRNESEERQHFDGPRGIPYIDSIYETGSGRVMEVVYENMIIYIVHRWVQGNRKRYRVESALYETKAQAIDSLDNGDEP